jgi:predicted metal-dependent phosphoesterase TrpH
MDLVTLTDHDSVEGALSIAHLPGTFVSEEVTLVLEGGRLAHLGVFDLTEGQHERIAALRVDPEALFAYLAEKRLPACFNHPFSALTGRRELVDFQAVLGRVPLVESLNGSMPSAHNHHARLLGRGAGMAGVGGSDSHTLAGVARAFTCVPGATNRQEFLDGLRRGLTLPEGRSGTYARLTEEVARVFAAGYSDALAKGDALRCPLRLLALLGLAPLLALIPAFTAAIYTHELAFGARWFARFHDPSRRRPTTPVPPNGLGAGPFPGAAGVAS